MTLTKDANEYSLGTHFGIQFDISKLGPNEVVDIVEGSPVHLDGEVMKGDTIVAINGESILKSSNISILLQDADSTSTLTFIKPGGIGNSMRCLFCQIYYKFILCLIISV